MSKAGSINASPVVNPFSTRLLHASSGVVLLVWFFWSVITGDHTISFRDGAHFYPSLYGFVHSQMAQGMPPFWNPLENGGIPLVANPAAAFFYPLKAILFLPFSNLHNYGLFVVAHVAICFFAMRYVCRRWGCSSGSACIGALAYAYSGNVLFQYSNVVFLIGAAWLPLALQSGQAAIYHRSFSKTAVHGLWLALIIVGGDIQGAWMAGTAMALYALVLWIIQDRTSTQKLASWQQNRFVLVVVAACVAGGAAAVQILPAVEFSGRSSRSVQVTPADIFHIPQHLLTASQIVRPDTGEPAHWYDTLIGDPPPPIKHEAMVYSFQVEPWRLLELFVPGIYGQRDRYWGIVFGIPKNLWTYTLYAGLIPVLMALFAVRFWKRRDPSISPLTAHAVEKQTIQIWCSWLLLISLLAALGRFTPLWVLRKLTGDQWGGPLVDGVGGVYWAMRTFLPGFAAFRFPAKLMVITAAAISMLCAFAIHQMENQGQRRDFSRLRKFGIPITIAASIAAYFIWPQFTAWGGITFSRNADAARMDFVLAVAQPLLVMSLLSYLAVFRRSLWVSLLLLLTVLDLAVAQRNLVETIPTAKAQEPANSAMAITDHHRAHGGSLLPPRTYVVRNFGKLQDVVHQYETEKEFLEGQYFLDDHIARLGYEGTLSLNLQEVWFDYLPMPTAEGVPMFVRPRRALDAWGTQYFVIPTTVGDAHNPNTSTAGLLTSWLEPRWSEQDPQPFPAGHDLQTIYSDKDVTVLFNSSAMPKAWIVHDVRWGPPIDVRDRAQWLALMEQIVFPLSNWIDVRRTAIVESQSDAPKSMLVSKENYASENVEFTTYEPAFMELQVDLKKAGLLVTAEVFDDDWSLEVASDGRDYQSQEILRTNRTMRGVMLPAGSHRLRMRYLPRAVYTGAVISILVLSTLFLIWVSSMAKRKRLLNQSS